MDMIFAQGEELSDLESLYIISPLLLVNGLYGFLTPNIKDIFLYSFIGTFLIVSIYCLELFLYPIDYSVEPDMMEAVNGSIILYALGVLGISFIATFFPLIFGWILGSIKRKIIG